MKTFAIGDVHGQYHALRRLIKQLPYQPGEDRLVLMGDLIDRGPDCDRVLEFARELQARDALVTILRGNHEQVLLDCYDHPESFRMWLAMGGNATYVNYCPDTRHMNWQQFARAFPASLRDFLAALPISYRNEHARFVHAGARLTPEGWRIDCAETALWYRAREFWAGYEGELLVVGHTPTNKIRKLLDEPLEPLREMSAWQRDALIAIDCGAGHGGRLCALELPARCYYYQPV